MASYLDEKQPKKPSASDDEKLLVELRERYDYAEKEWAEIRAEAAIDMAHVSGDPWRKEDREAREKAGRPCLSLDELGQHFNQVINGVRSEKRAIKFSPTGHGATDKTAQFYTDHTREIEYRSHAQVAYTTAFQDAIHRSYGACRVTTEYESDRSFNQQLRISPIVNPDMVLPDPDAQRPDSSDMKYCFVIESRSHDEFKREFGEQAKITDFSSLIKLYPSWVKENRVYIAEYWKVKTKKRKLLLIQLPALPPPPGVLNVRPPAPQAPLSVFEDELNLAQLPEGKLVVRERDVDYPSVCQYLTNGVEILSTTEWPGKYIPIITCYGMVIYVEGKRRILSMTRLARDPYMLYCYYRTCEAELVGMTPKTPYMAYEGQFSATQLLEVQKSLHEPVAALFAKPTIEGLPSGTVLPLPQRPTYEPPIQPLEIGAESARRAIQSAMGASPLPTSAQRRNEKSGVALEHIQDSSQRGSYHFNDHFDDMVRQVGVVIEDLIDKVIDTARDVGIREPNDAASTQRVNDPDDPTAVSTQGDHAVTVSTGPEYASAREAESAFADVLMQTPFAPLIADLAVKLKGGGPVLDEMAERLTPPQFAKPKDGQPPSAQQLQQQVGQMQQQLQQLQQAAQQMDQELKTRAAETQSKERIAQADTQVKAQTAQADGQLKWQIAQLEADVALKKAAMDNDTKLRLEELKLRGQAMQAEIDMREAELARASGVQAQQAEQSHEAGMMMQGQMASEQESEASRQHEAMLAEQAAAQQPEGGA